MRLLAIDPGRMTGWAFSAQKDRVEASGVWSLGIDASARPGRLADYIRATVKRHNVETLAYEFASMGGKFAGSMRRLDELAGVIKAVAMELNLPAWEFHIHAWKVRAVGRGNAQKPDVIRGLRTYYGIDVSRDDEASAVGILFAAQAGPPAPPIKQQAKALTKKLAERQPLLFGRRKR